MTRQRRWALSPAQEAMFIDALQQVRCELRELDAQILADAGATLDEYNTDIDVEAVRATVRAYLDSGARFHTRERNGPRSTYGDKDAIRQKVWALLKNGYVRSRATNIVAHELVGLNAQKVTLDKAVRTVRRYCKDLPKHVPQTKMHN